MIQKLYYHADRRDTYWVTITTMLAHHVFVNCSIGKRIRIDYTKVRKCFVKGRTKVSDKFIVKPRENSKKDERSMIMTLRIDRDLRGEFDRLSIQSDRSRNELMCMALQFALDHLEFQEQETENGCDSAESV